MLDHASPWFTGRRRILSMVALGGAVVAVCIAITTRLRSVEHLQATIAGECFQVLERVQTGHQRAERVAFLRSGRYLAVTCPRYDRLLIFEVEATTRKLKPVIDRKLKGKPVAIAETASGLLVLQRPAGDNRHIEPGFCEPFSLSGEPTGPRWPVGYDPDDLALNEDGSVAFVLLSGNSEGESNRPDPELVAFDLGQGEQPQPISRVRLGDSGTDPLRIYLSAKRTHAAILIRHGSMQGIDLSQPANLQRTGTVSLSGRERPALSASDDDVIVVPAECMADVAPLAAGGSDTEGAWQTLVTLEADEGRLVFYSTRATEPLGRLTLRGPAGIGQIRLSGLAHCPERNLIAVADRSGGLHLIERRSASAQTASKTDQISHTDLEPVQKRSGNRVQQDFDAGRRLAQSNLK